MKSMEEFTAKMDLPPVTQIGVVVRDLDQAMEYYTKIFGLGPFNPVLDFKPDKKLVYGGEITAPSQVREDGVGCNGF